MIKQKECEDFERCGLLLKNFKRIKVSVFRDYFGVFSFCVFSHLIFLNKGGYFYFLLNL